MRNNTGIIVGIIVVIIIIAGVFYFYSVSPTTPSTTAPSGTQEGMITYPAGGESWLPGQSYTLTWTPPSTPDSTTTQIFLIDTSLESQGASVSIADRVYGVPDTGSYQYTVPQTLKNGSYRIEIGTLNSNTFQVASSTQ
jgi:hypothetical protein